MIRTLKLMQVLAIYQILCGIMAFLISFSPPVSNPIEIIPEQNAMFWFLSCIFFCGFSVFSGIMLLLKKPAGFQLTFINQLLQVFQIAFAGTVFRDVCGLGLHLGAEFGTETAFMWAIQPPHFTLLLNMDHRNDYLLINLVAVLLAYYTIVLMKRYKTALQETERDNLDIGRNI